MSQGKISFKGYIVGEGRSGTTLFSAMLNRHSEICVTPETHFYRWISLYSGGPSGFISNYPESLREIFKYMNSTSVWTPDPKPIIRKYPTIRSVNDINLLFLAMGDLIAKQINKTFWLEKTPSHIRNIPLIDQLHPGQKVICIVRDGRAVAESLTRMDWASNDYIENCLRWLFTMRIYQRFLEDRANTLTIRYEDIVNYTVVSLKRVCTFLEVSYESSMLKQSTKDAYLIESGHQHKNKIMGEIDPSNIDLWKNQISRENIIYSEHLLGSELKKWGYETSISSLANKNRILISPFPPSNQTHHIIGNFVRDLLKTEPDLWLDNTINIGEKVVKLPLYWFQFEELLPARFSEQENQKSNRYFYTALFNLTKILLNKKTRFVLYYHPKHYDNCRWRKKRLIIAFAIRAAWKIIVPMNDYSSLEQCYGTIKPRQKYAVQPN